MQGPPFPLQNGGSPGSRGRGEWASPEWRGEWGSPECKKKPACVRSTKTATPPPNRDCAPKQRFRPKQRDLDAHSELATQPLEFQARKKRRRFSARGRPRPLRAPPVWGAAVSAIVRPPCLGRALVAFPRCPFISTISTHFRGFHSFPRFPPVSTNLHPNHGNEWKPWKRVEIVGMSGNRGNEWKPRELVELSGNEWESWK